MFYAEARELYANVHTQAKKTVNNYQKVSADPYLINMDNEVDESTVAQKVDLGVMEIPVRQIVGVTSSYPYPDMEYTRDFKPLAEVDTEFAEFWCQLYQDYLSSRGLSEPIVCIEYMNKFYVVDGKKRVSVLKAHGETRVFAHVIRWIPEYSGERNVKRYYEFMKYFPKTGLYQVCLSDPENFRLLQAEMGLDADQVWTDADRYHFMFTFVSVERAYLELLGEDSPITAADLFVALLKVYGLRKLSTMHSWELKEEIPKVFHFVHTKRAA